jgi:mono/diheme cytochrome c family protein
MIRKILPISMACMGLLLAACGTIATPEHATVIEPTGVHATAETAHTDEPTAEPTEAPTEVPTEIPTEVPTEAPTERASTGDPLDAVISLALPSRGEVLFNEEYFMTDLGEWQCKTCHNIEGDVIKIGPSLAGVLERAGSQVEGQGPYTYLYKSIRESQEFIVPGFEDAAPMPHFTDAILTDPQVYDIIAYLATLE